MPGSIAEGYGWGMRWLLAMIFGLGLLSGCGTKSFSDAFAVAVDSPQQVSIFDSQMGQSAEWAGKTMGQAAPGQPYTTEVSNVTTKMIFDNSPPSSIQVGLYLPDVTDTGYYAISIPQVSAGSITHEAPFVAWYSPTPVEQLPPLPVDLDFTAGPNGWIVNVTVSSPA